MKSFEFENESYELIKDYKDCFDIEVVNHLFTDYFKVFDYVFGDIAYGKLRLKGFYDPKNKKVSKINDFGNIDEYIKKQCAYDCSYFILKKIK